jgi:MYXO-CTERM domain-containing protein
MSAAGAADVFDDFSQVEGGGTCAMSPRANGNLYALPLVALLALGLRRRRPRG